MAKRKRTRSTSPKTKENNSMPKLYDCFDLKGVSLSEIGEAYNINYPILHKRVLIEGEDIEKVVRAEYVKPEE